MNRALFLDRDGVINEDYGYVHKIEDFHFREGIFDVCRAAQRERMNIIVVTNQAGIGRGYYSGDDFQKLTSYMIDMFALEQIYISDVYHCPYHPDHGIGHYKRASFCRKPHPGMLVTACSNHNINPRHSLMIGDRESDRDAAMALGIPFYVDASKTGWAHHAETVLRY
jgi:D-glycero-D-manno-heptose 1,7-bisphosphate phosphatase